MTGYRKELISPTGETYTSTSPIETNDLVFGNGYREADEADEVGAGAEPPDDDKVSEKPAGSYEYGGEVSP